MEGRHGNIEGSEGRNSVTRTHKIAQQRQHRGQQPVYLDFILSRPQKAAPLCRGPG